MKFFWRAVRAMRSAYAPAHFADRDTQIQFAVFIR
jgi:hypothetical protein